MERNWDNSEYRDDRNRRYSRNQENERDRNDRRNNYERNRYDDTPQDPDTYRGAYRLDNSSDHRNVSTYYGFGGEDRRDERRGSPDERNRRETYDTYNNRNQDRPNRNERDEGNYRQERNEHTPGWRDYMNHSDNWGSSNFNNDYGPDHYPHRSGENTGNMAGSLSYGYDGGQVSNPDSDRRYNPLTGEIRHEQEIRNRRHQGRNPSSYRLHNLNDDRRDY